MSTSQLSFVYVDEEGLLSLLEEEITSDMDVVTYILSLFVDRFAGMKIKREDLPAQLVTTAQEALRQPRLIRKSRQEVEDICFDTILVLCKYDHELAQAAWSQVKDTGRGREIVPMLTTLPRVSPPEQDTRRKDLDGILVPTREFFARSFLRTIREAR